MREIQNAALQLRDLGRLDGVLNVESLHFHKMKGLLETIHTDEFIEYLHFLIRANQEEKLNRIRYYLRMFCAQKSVQNMLNLPEFPQDILETMLLDSFFGKAINSCGEMEQVFDESWCFLSPEKCLSLLLDAPFISRDLHISMNLLIYLDNAYFDEYLSRKPDAEVFMMHMVNCIPERLISHIFLSYPVFYGYAYWILATQDTPEARQALKSFESQIDEAKQADTIIHNLQQARINVDTHEEKLQEACTSNIRNVEWKKVLSIRDQMRNIKDSRRILSLLESRNVFQTSLEVQVLKQLLLDQTVAAGQNAG